MEQEQFEELKSEVKEMKLCVGKMHKTMTDIQQAIMGNPLRGDGGMAKDMENMGKVNRDQLSRIVKLEKGFFRVKYVYALLHWMGGGILAFVAEFLLNKFSH